MKRFLLATGFLAGSAFSASATVDLYCSGEGAEVHLGMGTLPYASIISASIEAEGKSWSTAEQTIAVGQAFSNDNVFMVDFSDSNINELVARLRLVRAAEGDDYGTAGLLQIVGTGVFAVVCES